MYFYTVCFVCRHRLIAHTARGPCPSAIASCHHRFDSSDMPRSTTVREWCSLLARCCSDCCPLLQGHGKLARMPSCNNDLLTDFVYLMLRTLTHHPSSYIKPGGYSEQSFSMVVDYCVKRQASKKASKVVTDSAAQVIRSHNSWCLELSPLLKRYHIAWWCLQPLT